MENLTPDQIHLSDVSPVIDRSLLRFVNTEFQSISGDPILARLHLAEWQFGSSEFNDISAMGYVFAYSIKDDVHIYVEVIFITESANNLHTDWRPWKTFRIEYPDGAYDSNFNREITRALQHHLVDLEDDLSTEVNFEVVLKATHKLSLASNLLLDVLNDLTPNFPSKNKIEESLSAVQNAANDIRHELGKLT